MRDAARARGAARYARGARSAPLLHGRPPRMAPLISRRAMFAVRFVVNLPRVICLSLLHASFVVYPSTPAGDTPRRAVRLFRVCFTGLFIEIRRLVHGHI